MKHYLTPIFYLLLIICYCASCSERESTSSTSSVAQLTAFSFQANDSIPGLGEAEFKIEELIDTGLVRCVDSLRYGTRLDSVVPKFTFAVSVATAIMQMGDTAIVLTGNDTLDFNRTPIYLSITSTDMTNTKVYEIQVFVHQADPELFTWETLTEQAFEIQNAEQKVVEHNELFCWFVNDGSQTELYTSSDAMLWSKQTISGLPDNCRVNTIVCANDTLYYADNATLYYSADATSWQQKDLTADNILLPAMLLPLNDKALAVIEQNDELYLAYVNAETITNLQIPLDEDFPVSGFATVCFQSSSLRDRAMILGGFARNGKNLHNRWNIERLAASNQLRIVDYTIERPLPSALSGTSMIWYNNSLMMLGGIDEQGATIGRIFYVSYDEGMQWALIDSAKCNLPDAYTERYRQSMLVKDNYIYVFGGQSNTKCYTDVYRGKLNSIDW